MKQFEVTFIVDPVLSDDEIKSTAKNYTDLITTEGGTVVQIDEMGLKQLAYAITKRNTGVYFGIEFQSNAGEFIPKLELAMKRDERILRFLTVRLDKYGVKYNDDKRNGKIGKKREPKKKSSSVEENQ
ncbi:MAG: 30S ribosomal protein S6 [Saprospiraceae bacterium]